jgi:hypothetical protein
MIETSECPFCKRSDVEAGRCASQEGGWKDGAWFICLQCGKFIDDDDAHTLITHRKVDLRLVSSWIREQNDQGLEVAIRRADAARLESLPFPSFKERMESYLLALAKRSTSLESQIPIFDPSLIATACCSSERELRIITRHLVDEGYMRLSDSVATKGSTARLTARGHMFCDELRAARTASSQGFIAMWFHEEMEAARWHGFEPGVRNAGYKPHRVDDAQHIDKIDDRIIAEIRRSRFVVADLTGHRGGVYYEAGFALGLGKPVFYTCREDHSKEIHFDIRQFNCIIWRAREACR